MPRYLNNLFRSPPRPGESGPENHPGVEELACLAQGGLGPDRRREVIGHVLGCAACHDLLDSTLTELELDRSSESRGSGGLWKRPGLALAASVVIALVGVGVYQNLPDHKRGLAPAVRVEETRERAESSTAATLSKVVKVPSKAPEADSAGPGSMSEQEAPVGAEAASPLAPTPAPAPSSPVQPEMVAQAPPGKVTRGISGEASRLDQEDSSQALAKARPAQSPPPSPPARSTLYLLLDDRLAALLRENNRQVWTDPDRIGRFQELIKALGSARELPDQIAWAGPYPEKLLAEGAPRGLMITIENGRAVLELKAE